MKNRFLIKLEFLNKYTYKNYTIIYKTYECLYNTGCTCKFSSSTLKVNAVSLITRGDFLYTYNYSLIMYISFKFYFSEENIKWMQYFIIVHRIFITLEQFKKKILIINVYKYNLRMGISACLVNHSVYTIILYIYYMEHIP